MIVIIACGNRKQNYAVEAKNLYTGSLFKLARQAAESSQYPWFIFSAKYGLVQPNQIIEPYDVTYGQGQGVGWETIKQQANALQINNPVVSFCPIAYTNILRQAIAQIIYHPMRGLRIGQQQKFLRLYSDNPNDAQIMVS
jgi:hypothetical protein